MKRRLMSVLMVLSIMGSFSFDVYASERDVLASDLVYREVKRDASIDEQIAEEMRLGDMELISQLVEAEAGNQPLEGKRLVAAVVLNRVESDEFPNTVEEVIFQKGQFSVISNGAFDDAAWHMSDSSYDAVRMEMDSRSNTKVLYFANKLSLVSGKGTAFRVGGHWFNH